MGIHYSEVGTRMYQAPEVIEKRSYRGEMVDIFSIGVILFLMVTGSMPYRTQACIQDELYRLIYLKKKEDFWLEWSKMM